MKLFRLLLLALGILGKNGEEENGDGKVTHNASDVQKLNELRRAILDAQVRLLFLCVILSERTHVSSPNVVI